MGRIRDVLRLPLLPASKATRAALSSALETAGVRRWLSRHRRFATDRALRRGGARGRGSGGEAPRFSSSRRRSTPERCAPPSAVTDGTWRVNGWVKQGILLGFRLGALAPRSTGGGPFPFFDKDTYPLRPVGPERRRPHRARRIAACATAATWRAGSSACRRCISTSARMWTRARWSTRMRWSARARRSASGCISRRRRRSAACWSRSGALPVIIEDDVLVGGNCGVYEGAVVRARRGARARAPSSPGSTPVFDLVHDRVYRREGDRPLEIPAGAVVVPGTRPVRSGPGAERGIALYAPVIVKYRDEKTDTAVRLEELLR